MDLGSWTCLFVGPQMAMVDDATRRVLTIAGCMMYLEKLDRKAVKEDGRTVIVQTEWKSYSVGSRAGILFNSFVESERGECPVNFLLSGRDLEHGAEIIRRANEEEGAVATEMYSGVLPVPELYQYKDLRPGKLN